MTDKWKICLNESLVKETTNREDLLGTIIAMMESSITQKITLEKIPDEPILEAVVKA